MAIDFPNSPGLNDTHTVGSKTWQYDGEKWILATTSVSVLNDLGDVDLSLSTSGDYLKYDGTKWVNDPINLGTDTVGSYVASLVAGTGVTITNNSGEGATPTIAIGQAVATNSSVSFSSVTASGVELGLFSNTITTSSGDLTISPASLTVNIGNNISATGSITGGSVTSNGSLITTGTFTVQQIREKIIDSSISTNVMTCSYTTGSIYYQETNPSANFTVNVTNLPTDNGYTATISIFVTQGSTGYIPNALQIGGVGQTIKWSGGSAPTPTSSSGKIDVFTFTLIRRSSTWTVLGSANLNY